MSGAEVFSAGQFIEAEETKSIRIHDDFENTFKKVVIRDNRVVGAVLFGDTSDSSRLLSMMRSKTDISQMSKASLLPSEAGEGQGESLVAAMEDGDTVCGCNGVTKGEIVCAIKDQANDG